MPDNWYSVKNAGDVVSPALLVYPERIEENIKRMIRIAGKADVLRPHVKTHKMSEVIRLQVSHGITKFKCSTIAEADVAASAGGSDVMLAMQPVGVNIDRFFNLMNKYPSVKFSAIVDNMDTFRLIESQAQNQKMQVNLWVDVNNGMNRTGISPTKEARKLYLAIAIGSYCHAEGLHVYDGHLHESDVELRRLKCESAFEAIDKLIFYIRDSGLERPLVVAGGTPTFPFHAGKKYIQTSPGTCLLWDWGYSERMPDLEFVHAAVLLTRVVSKPADHLICLDLGHKAIAAEMPHPRIRFFDLHVEKFVNHSEEHLVIESRHAGKYRCGDLIYGIPWHICPTVPRYPFAYTVHNNMIDGMWKVDARDR